MLRKSRFSWNNLKLGERVIFLSFGSAFLSMFLSWSYGSFFPQNGFTQLMVVFLISWAYPLHAIFNNRKINKIAGFGCSLAPAIAASLFISSKNADIFGGFMNLAGNGAWIFLLSSLALGVGVYICNRGYIQEAPTDPSESLPPK